MGKTYLSVRRVGATVRLLLPILALACGSAAAQPAASPVRMAHDMAAFSSDDMEGRKPGTSGETKALAWLEAAFAEAGLEPAGVQGWRQPVALVEHDPVASAMVVRVAGRRIDPTPETLLIGRGPRERVRGAPVVYAGFAVHAAPLPPGAVALYHNADVPGSALSPIDFAERRANLLAGGAAAILEVVDDAAYAKLRDTPDSRDDVVELADSPSAVIRGFISVSAARRWLAAAGQDLAALDQLAARPDFAPVRIDARADISVTTRIRNFTSYNIVGRLAGSRRPDQAVVYTAHWDSFGVCRTTGSDRLCNGAVDNASGIAGLVETARLFRSGPQPERSILFIATTAEERGMLGAKAYAQHPIVPLRNTIAALNWDTIAIYGRGRPVGVVGAGLTTADPLIARLAADQGRTLDTGAGVKAVLKSSDAWAMMRAGVPAFIVSSTIARLAPDKGQPFLDYLTSRYHGPADEFHPGIPMDGAAEDVELGYRLGLAFAASDAAVDFLPEAPFTRAAEVRPHHADQP